MNRQKQIEELFRKLAIVESKQNVFDREIKKLRFQIERLQEETDFETLKPQKEEEKQTQQDPIFIDDQPKEKQIAEVEEEPVLSSGQQQREPLRRRIQRPSDSSKLFPQKRKNTQKSGLEAFIGKNVVNIIGVIVIVIGVGIGAKYAIDNDLISPLTRIILGYVTGAGLLVFAILLKKKYENFSAVLLSGAMAIFYFVTFIGYDFYALFPKGVAFGLMLIFTVFTVVASLNYNRQIIAHIGLVGAYAVPFLLSDGSGQAMVLFIYMTIINLGILAICIKKYWKPLYINAFVLTWLIFMAWFGAKYELAEHFGLSLVFSALFFVIFYISFLTYKLIKSETFNVGDVILLLLNSFIFYGIGYAVLAENPQTENLVGLFTIGNALVHFVVSVILYQNKLADRNLFYLASGLVLIFVTIAVPVQLDGNWVTLIWALEAALLFWIGRSKKVGVYEALSFPLMILALGSMIQDWGIAVSESDYYYAVDLKTSVTPILNTLFLTSIVFALSFFAIHFIHRQDKYTSALREKDNSLLDFMGGIIFLILLLALYVPIVVEITIYFNQLLEASEVKVIGEYSNERSFYDTDLRSFQIVWILNYTLLFFIGLGIYCIQKVKHQLSIVFYYIASIFVLLIFLSGGLYELSELRESYISQELAKYYQIGKANLWIRYLSFGLVAVLLFTLFRLAKSNKKLNLMPLCDFIIHSTVMWLLSAELVHVLGLSGNADTYKLGLSILWGVYSLIVVALGIWKRKKYLRIAGLSWFGITLFKLFFYDIAHLPTISKTIVFVSLGILLLIISFLYNKYTKQLGEEEKENES